MEYDYYYYPYIIYSKIFIDFSLHSYTLSAKIFLIDDFYSMNVKFIFSLF